jgi:hypothetical protein
MVTGILFLRGNAGSGMWVILISYLQPILRIMRVNLSQLLHVPSRCGTYAQGQIHYLLGMYFGEKWRKYGGGLSTETSFTPSGKSRHFSTYLQFAVVQPAMIYMWTSQTPKQLSQYISPLEFLTIFFLTSCRILGSHSSGYEVFCLLGYTIVQFVESQPTFRKNILSQSSCLKSKSRFAFYALHADFFLGLLFNPEDRGDMVLRNVVWLWTYCTALCSRRENSFLTDVESRVCRLRITVRKNKVGPCFKIRADSRQGTRKTMKNFSRGSKFHRLYSKKQSFKQSYKSERLTLRWSLWLEI